MTNFGTSTESYRKCNEICVNSESNDDDPENDVRTFKFPTIRAAIQMVDELTQFAQNSLEDEQLFISLNSVCRLLKEIILRLKQEILKVTFLGK